MANKCNVLGKETGCEASLLPRASVAMSYCLTVGIASKDRADVLESTLQLLLNFGLGRCHIIICDDGSSPPLAPNSLKQFPLKTIIRNEESRGQALARNQIVAQCRTEFLLQLDDDSYPIEGDFRELIDIVSDLDNWIAIALPFEEPARNRSFPSKVEVGKPVKVRAFVGCSVLINVSAFKALGGYADWIGRITEEEELCIRAIDQGFSVYFIDSVRIRHEVSDVNRNTNAILQRSFRNWSLLWVVNAPLLLGLSRLTILFLQSIVVYCRKRNMHGVYGFWEAMHLVPYVWKHRSPIKWKTYFDFYARPHVLELFNKKL